MKKFALFTFLPFMITSCSTTLSSRYTNENTVYRINKANVTLVSKCKGEKYPNQDRLAEILTDEIKKDFCSKKKCVSGKDLTDNVVDLYFDIIYTRVFMGEAFSCSDSYATSTFTFRNIAKMNEKVIIDHSSKGQMFYSRGLFGNLAMLLRQLTFTGNAALENKTLIGISKNFSREMIKRL